MNPKNILLDSNGNCKLSDFRKRIEDPSRENDDFWRLGVLIYKLLTGNFPILDQEKQIDKLNIQTLNISKQAKNILKCLLINLSIKEKEQNLKLLQSLKKNDFFTNFNWFKLEQGRLVSPFKSYLVNISILFFLMIKN